MFTKIQQIFHNTPKMVRVTLLIIYDVLAVALAEFLALWTRFEFSVSHITQEYMEHALKYTLINVIVTIAVFAFMKLYTSLWQYASV